VRRPHLQRRIGSRRSSSSIRSLSAADLAARVPLDTLVADEVPVLVEVRLVAPEHVVRGRNPFQLEKLDDDLPRPVVGALEGRDALRLESRDLGELLPGALSELPARQATARLTF
jgi:hypothetical protein